MSFLRVAIRLLLLMAWLCPGSVLAVLVVEKGEINQPVGLQLQFLEDQTNGLGIEDILKPENQARFQYVKSATPNFSFSRSTYWLRIAIEWRSPDKPQYFLWQQYALTDYLLFYRPDHDGHYVVSATGDQQDFSHRELPTRAFGITLEPRPGETSVIYVQAYGAGTMNFDFGISSAAGAIASTETRHLLFGLYYGALLALVLYNLILFYSFRDAAYGYYCLYMVGLGMTFFDINGLAFRYLWPNTPIMNTWFLLFTYGCLFGLLQFTRHFLSLPSKMPRLDKWLWAMIALCLVALAGVLVIPARYLYSMNQAITLLVALITLYAGVHLWIQGFKPARYFVAATGWYAVGLITYPLQNFGVIPTSVLSNYSVQIGSALEMVLLSFALADRINIIKQEKLSAEQKARRQLEEANLLLEQRVSERTGDLLDSVRALQEKHEVLVATQQQLVQAEKMSGLGSLVAGVAHEINNPANFTRLSAENLERDLNRLKEFLWALADDDTDPALMDELDKRFLRLLQHVDLVHEGTIRLNRIVADLRRFSRLDESESKIACPDLGLEATLNLVRSQYKDHVSIHYVADNPEAEGHCYPAALNQVFMNLAVNACQAILEKAQQGLAVADGQGLVGELGVNSHAFQRDGTLHWQVSFIDNGVGMDAATQQKMFEPFFTTKAVGEGTGLGLSITYGIVQKHNGHIQVESEPGVGSCFTLTIPLAFGVETVLT